jgi:hypothetical protein
MIHARIGLLVALLLAGALPARADAPPAAQDPATRARAAFEQLQTGKLDRTALTPALNADLTDAVRASMTARLAPFGPPPGPLALRSKYDSDGVMTYVFRVRWPNGSVDYVFGIDDTSGKIAKLYFVPGP